MSVDGLKTAPNMPWWGKLAGTAIMLVCVFYAVQHPHSFFYYFVKMLVIPVP